MRRHDGPHFVMIARPATTLVVCVLAVTNGVNAATQADEALTALESFAGAQLAEGTVYWDENANGRRDSDEAGVPGVRITAQHRVVTTGEDGRFSFTSNRPFLAVSMSWPSGTWPTGRWFELLQRPAQRDIAFGLRRDDQQLPLVFVQFTDPHGFVVEACRIIPEECRHNGLTPKFYVATGDFMDQYARVENMPEARRLFANIRKALDEAAAPLFMVPGNHDVFLVPGGATYGPVRPQAAMHPLSGLKAWEKFVCPKYWSFTTAGVHLLGLEWGEVFAGKMDRYSPAMKNWVDAESRSLPAKTRLIVACHDAVWVESHKKFLDYGQELALFGHSHLEGPVMGRKTMLSAGECRSVKGQIKDGRPRGYRIVVVEQDRIDTFYKGLGENRAIIINTPRKYITLRNGPTFTVAAQAFDPQSRISDIDITLAGRRLEVKRSRRRFWSDVEATFETADLADGFHELVIRTTWPDGALALRQSCLVFTGRQAPFPARGPARLTGNVHKLDRTYELQFNGTGIGSVTPTGKKFEPFSFDVPATLLKRLNTVTIPGAPSNLKLWDVIMHYGGQPHVDHRQAWDRLPQSEDVHHIVYIDLTRPHRETWRIKKVGG